MRMTAPGILLVVLGVAPLDAQVVPTRAAIEGAAWQDSATFFAIVNRRFTMAK